MKKTDHNTGSDVSSDNWVKVTIPVWTSRLFSLYLACSEVLQQESSLSTVYETNVRSQLNFWDFENILKDSKKISIIHFYIYYNVSALYSTAFLSIKPYLLKSQTFTLSWQLISLQACLCPHIPSEVHVTFKLQYATLTVSAPVVKGRLSALQSLDAPVCLTLLYKKAFKILFDFTVFVLDVYNLKKRENRTCVLTKT